MVKPIQRVLIIVSGLAFLSSMGFMAASVWSGNPSSQHSARSSQPGEEEFNNQLLAQESGYVAVLEREPDNEIALQGLIQTRLALQKWEEVVEPLETLAESAPDNPDVWQALAAVRIQLQDYEGAIAPLEKLAKLTPENEELKEQLAKLKEEVKKLQEQPKIPNEE
ncbi:MAG: tetratricopeptide repeat protein [Cyanobacteria bacterium SBLK]|nr:tetratricopeptide repeat protein [Cyanobacteria bacterium SBLK]